jgi:hypothetical protein
MPEDATIAPPKYAVNSSLNAVPVYKAFGFVPTSGFAHVHGISFLPMQLIVQAQ